jgi:uncharacterized RDD family membrane protein YckC
MEDGLGREEAIPQKSRSVADRVAARYAKAPSYSEMLAAEARNAARAAEAAAVAAGEARDAAQAILVGLDVNMHEGRERAQEPVRARHAGGFAETFRETETSSMHSRSLSIAEAVEEPAIDEEPIAPIQPLPAKLLEFPRELVATRKARPRLAEGPLREEYDRDAAQSQLRIFEVEQETISTRPEVEPVLPGWSSIRLDSDRNIAASTGSFWGDAQPMNPQSTPSFRQEASSPAAFELPLQTASLEDRLMAGIVDLAMVFGGFLVFVFVFVACTTHPPTGKPAMVGAAVALFAFAMIYQLLFFSFGADTPGMRYAKIALCTFDDENPTRKAMQRRIGALLLSASPLGLGVLWALFDDDRLGWHDRISRTYQRSYR